MPYFVYRVRPLGLLDKLAAFDAFRDASQHAKALRAAEPPGPARIKVIHAEHELEAEDLLSRVREPQPSEPD